MVGCGNEVGMRERDARKLDQTTQAELRRQAVRLRKSGKSRAEVAGLLGVHVKTITRWTGEHKKRGAAVFASRQRGPKPRLFRIHRRIGHLKSCSQCRQHNRKVLAARTASLLPDALRAARI